MGKAGLLDMLKCVVMAALGALWYQQDFPWLGAGALWVSGWFGGVAMMEFVEWHGTKSQRSVP